MFLSIFSNKKLTQKGACSWDVLYEYSQLNMSSDCIVILFMIWEKCENEVLCTR